MKRKVALLLCLLYGIAPVRADTPRFIDPLDQPALISDKPASVALLGAAPAGKRMVAVGAWGRILRSDEQGEDWQQVESPVSSDLTAVTFPVAELGWAVGHDGVVLHSRDGGNSWQKQLDGRDIANILVRHYQQRSEEGNPEATEILDEMIQLASQPPAFPLMDVWFRNEREGFVVGAFNLILHTRNGGETWQPWMEKVDNPRRYHLYSIRGNGDDVYIAGELGLLLKLDDRTQRFAALPSPYDGSFFGLITTKQRLIAFGLRGNAFQSWDAGQTWRRLSNRSESTLIAGAFLPDGTAILLDQGGELLKSAPYSEGLQDIQHSSSFPAFFISTDPAGSGLVLVGPAGAQSVAGSNGRSGH